MTIDLRAAWNQIGLILAAVAVLYVLKAAVIFAVCNMMRIAMPAAAEAAVLLAQAGEFGFVVVSLGAANGVLDPPLAQFVIVVVGIGMVVTPFFADLGRRARLLEAENVPYVALDIGGNLVASQRRHGRAVFYGDAGRPELLERVGGSKARAFVVTVNASHAAERMVLAARSVQADARVFARAKDPEHAASLLQIGAVGVIPEAVEASLQLGGRLLEALGLPEEAVMQRLAAERREEVGRLDRPPVV
jgi:CPA2 family monovalent cation:H+ antiporter-2